MEIDLTRWRGPIISALGFARKETEMRVHLLACVVIASMLVTSCGRRESEEGMEAQTKKVPSQETVRPELTSSPKGSPTEFKYPAAAPPEGALPREVTVEIDRRIGRMRLPARPTEQTADGVVLHPTEIAPDDR